MLEWAIVGGVLFAVYAMSRIDKLEREVRFLRSDLEHLQRMRR
ncbi:MAG: hypothetical protein AB7O44_33280 [Hyphomicrobiaceae bacterium]